MFGHLKSSYWVHLMEGGELPAEYRSHLDDCAQCRATWKSLESIQTELGSLDSEIPEPDWTQFRSSVRDRILSRSIQRKTAFRRWTGWAVRPAMALALSLLFVAGVTTVTIMWNAGKSARPSTSAATPAFEPAPELMEAGSERALFDDLVQLGDVEREQLQKILDSSEKGSRYR
jgi:hypothetical protein